MLSGRIQVFLHQHGVDPAAVLATDAGQPACVREAEPVVQRGRRVAAGVGDDRDDLPRARRRAPRQQPAEQGTADPAAGVAGGEVHRVLDRVPVGGFGPPRAGIGKPADVAAVLSHQERQLPGGQFVEAPLPVRRGRRDLLERRHAGRDVVREDRGDLFGVRGPRCADHGLLRRQSNAPDSRRCYGRRLGGHSHRIGHRSCLNCFQRLSCTTVQ